MIKIREEDKEFLIRNIPDIRQPLQNNNLRETLLVLDNAIMIDGIGGAPNYDLTGYGRKLQNIYDEIYIQNAN